MWYLEVGWEEFRNKVYIRFGEADWLVWVYREDLYLFTRHFQQYGSLYKRATTNVSGPDTQNYHSSMANLARYTRWY